MSVNILSRSSTEVIIEWMEPTEGSGCPITGYSVIADDGLLGEFIEIESSLPATQFKYTVTSPAAVLVVGFKYRFAVVAYNVIG